jgi:replication factor C subunit 2/4
VEEKEILKRLQHICDLEKIQFTGDGLMAILYTSQGDMRQVNLLFKLFELFY